MRNKVSELPSPLSALSSPPGGQINGEEGKGSFWDANNRETITTWGGWGKAVYHIYQVANSYVKILI